MTSGSGTRFCSPLVPWQPPRRGSGGSGGKVAVATQILFLHVPQHDELRRLIIVGRIAAAGSGRIAAAGERPQGVDDKR